MKMLNLFKAPPQANFDTKNAKENYSAYMNRNREIKIRCCGSKIFSSPNQIFNETNMLASSESTTFFRKLMIPPLKQINCSYIITNLFLVEQMKGHPENTFFFNK